MSYLIFSAVLSLLAPAPTSVDLVAAMPPNCESILILRFEPLMRANSLAADPLRSWMEEEAQEVGDSPKDIVDLVMTYSARAGISTLVWGGSDFVAPNGVGASRFNHRQILVLDGPSEPLRKALVAQAQKARIIKLQEIDGAAIFVGRVVESAGYRGAEVASGIYVSVLEPRLVISARSLADLRFMIASLRATGAPPNARLHDLAVIAEMDSPIVILRDFRLPEFEREASDLQPAAPLPFAMWQSDPAEPNFHLAFPMERFESDQERLEARFLGEVMNYLMDEDGFSFSLSSDEGYVTRGTLVLKADEDADHHIYLLAIWFFGIQFII